MSVSERLVLEFTRLKFSLLTVYSPSKTAVKAFDLFSTPRKKALPEGEQMEKAEKCLVVSNNLNLSLYRWGTNNTKKVLILHGFESGATKFSGYVDPLLQKGYEVLALDAQAHGSSEGTRITLPGYVQNIKDTYARYGPFDAYISHSLGASAVAHFLETQSGGETARVVLIAPSTEASSIINRFYNILKLKTPVRNHFDRLVKERSGNAAGYFSVIRALGNIPAPVLWIHDEDDAVTPFSDAEKVKDHDYHHVTFLSTRGLGHNRIYRDDSVKSRIFGFL
ncbi:MAG: alpha/beta hydrolase [Chitinophagaceae bacterium]|nr:alpha/beta hydrolase [Chitinophagaceae bacterium]MCW5929862.1 alpha/beta hydrolase [Chitinophagaceae bacterium]